MDEYRQPFETKTDAAHAPQGSLFRAKVWLSPLHLRLAVLVAGVLLPLLLLTGAIVYQSYNTARTEAGQRVLQTTRSTVAIIDRELQIQIGSLQDIADSPALAAGHLDQFRAEAVTFLQRYPAGTALSVSDSAGQQVLNTSVPAGAPLPPRANMAIVNRVFATGKPAVSDMYMSTVLQRPNFTLDVPVLRDGKVVYDVALSAPRAVFFDILAGLDLPQGWVASIFDRNAHHVARQPAFATAEITSASDSLRAHIRDGDDRIVETVSLEGTPLLTAFSRSAQYQWIVAIGMPRETLAGPARRAFLVAVATGGLLLAIGLVFAANMATQLIRADRQRELLVNELNHRVKNALASVQAIVSRGLRNAASPGEARAAIEARIMALSRAHNILTAHNWESAALHGLAAAVLEPYAGPGPQRLTLTGPPVTLSPRAAVPLAMTLNELDTNAAKYGAFVVPDGKVSLTWAHVNPRRLRLEWHEAGGPPVHPPTREGFGTQFITRTVEAELRGTYTAVFEPAGFKAVFEIEI